MIHDVIQFLHDNRIAYLGTVDFKNRPRVRPFHLRVVLNGKLWFCTSSEKDVYEQIEHNPYIELCVCSENHEWLRLHGKAVFKDNKEIKEACMRNSHLKLEFDSPDHPCFRVFYLEEAHAVITGANGKIKGQYEL